MVKGFGGSGFGAWGLVIRVLGSGFSTERLLFVYSSFLAMVRFRIYKVFGGRESIQAFTGHDTVILPQRLHVPV